MLQVQAVPPGRYLVAVSGGVDSMVLLELLQRQPGLELVVAHANHGLRSDADEDEALVRQTAERLGLAFESIRLELPDASEATARAARYAFLKDLKQKHQAAGVITAHHQDDLIETATLNLLRGTGHRGLGAMINNKRLLRPMLGVSKQAILSYAKANQVTWREDSTNLDTKYLRNYIRHHVMPKINAKPVARAKLLEIIHKTATLSQQIADLTEELYETVQRDGGVGRRQFIMLPHDASREFMASWLRDKGAGQVGRRQIDRLVVLAKAGKPRSSYAVKEDLSLQLEGSVLILGKPIR